MQLHMRVPTMKDRPNPRGQCSPAQPWWERSGSSTVVAAGWSSDLGLPTKHRFPPPLEAVRDPHGPYAFRSHHRCGTADRKSVV